jgi:type I restriction enzyme S subunit
MTAMEKNNKTLNVPHLRFPEFYGEWDHMSLSDIADIVGGGTPDTSVVEYWGGNIQWFTPSEIGKEKYARLSERTITEAGIKNSSAKLLPQGTVLLSSRATIGECSIARQECTTNQGFQSLIAETDKVTSEFLYYLVPTIKKEMLRRSCGSTFLEISANELRKIYVYRPSLIEQNKLAEFMSLLDLRIKTQKKIIEKYESLIRGLITSLNKGEICKCKATALKDVLTEVHEKNVKNHEVCSVSVSQGVINQIDYLGRSFAAKEVLHYNVVHYGDLVYTKSPTGEFPYGIVKRSNLDRPVAVSPLYGVYRPVNDTIGIYLHLYFKSPVYTKNYLHSLIQKGAKNTINITNQHFLNNKIQIPEPDVLEIFVHTASEIEKKIQAENRVLASFEKQKNYLLSKMFI